MTEQSQRLLQAILEKLVVTGKSNELSHHILAELVNNVTAKAMRESVEELSAANMLVVDRGMFGDYSVKVTNWAWEKIAKKYLNFDPTQDAQIILNYLAKSNIEVTGADIEKHTQLTPSRINIAIRLLESRNKVHFGRHEHPVPEGYIFTRVQLG